MARTFVVVGESTTVMADFDDCLLEIDKMVGTDRQAVRRKFRRARRSRPTSKHRIERILREHVLDVRNKQFLMLLFMINAQNNDWLDFIQQFLTSVGKQIVDVRIDGCAITLCFLHRWARNQSAQIAPMHIASGVVVRIKKISVLRNFGPISRKELFQDKRLEKPGGMSQVPLGRADVGY